MRKYVVTGLLMILTLPVLADGPAPRAPVVRVPPVSHTFKTALTIEDTYVVEEHAGGTNYFLAVYETDSDVFLRIRSDTDQAQTWVLYGGQYFPDPVQYNAGDTIIVECSSCRSIADTATVRVRLYPAGERNTTR